MNYTRLLIMFGFLIGNYAYIQTDEHLAKISLFDKVVVILALSNTMYMGAKQFFGF